jgi:dihydroorotate dehydrogenase (NAD+) catalytic subunit
MMNAIGLQNVGIERFKKEKMPFLRDCGAPVIVNVAGETVEDFAFLCRALSEEEGVAAIELNISCPNVAHGLDFATDPALAEDVVAHARRATHLPLLAKLSPNVTDISLIARATEAGGADALSVANTFVGLAVDIRTRRPRLSNITGGLSGPAIKPLALRAVWKCAGAVQIPIVGVGGIATAQDALEFLIAGARAIQVGTATFAQPGAALTIIEGINQYLDDNGFTDISQIVGSLQTR